MAWAGPGVPVVVCLATLSARRRVFAGVAGSVADVAAQFAAFWGHPVVAARSSRVPALAVAGLPGVPAAALRGADPALAGAWRPTVRSSTVEQRAEEAAGPRWDGPQEESQADCQGLVEERCSGLRDDPQGGRAGDLWVVRCSAVPAWFQLA